MIEMLINVPEVKQPNLFHSNTECVKDLDYKASLFWSFLKRALFSEAAGAISKVGLSQKQNLH